jgi:phage recombination protein Bet
MAQNNQIEKAKQGEREMTWETDGGPVTLTLALVKRRFCEKASDLEAYEFLQFCRYHQLNPWLKEAYLIKYSQSDPAAIVVAYTKFIERARENPFYDGYESGLIVERNGAVERVAGAFTLKADVLIGSWARVHLRGQAYPVYVELNLDQIIQKKSGGEVNRMWSRMPNIMAEKVAIATAHRRSLSEVRGMYVDGETAASDSLELDGGADLLDLKAIDAEMGFTESPPATPTPVRDAMGVPVSEPPKAPARTPLNQGDARFEKAFWAAMEDARVSREFAYQCMDGLEPSEWTKQHNSRGSELVEMVTTAWRETYAGPPELQESPPDEQPDLFIRGPEFAG